MKKVVTDLSYKAGFNFCLDHDDWNEFKKPRLSAKSDDWYRGFYEYREAYFNAVKENAKTGKSLVFPAKKV